MKINVYIRYNTFLFLCLFPFMDAVADPPKFVYRIDTRKPDTIFVNGFSSWGDNLNVFSHISGESCVEQESNNRNSGFISSSGSATWAMTMANLRAMQFPGETIYVYRIRADDSFFNAVASLSMYQGMHPSAQITSINFEPSRDSTEYITPRRIEPENIESATEFLVNNPGYPPTPNSYSNRDYVSADTRASVAAYNGTSDQINRRSTWVRYTPPESACMASRDSTRDSRWNSSFYKLESIFITIMGLDLMITP